MKSLSSARSFSRATATLAVCIFSTTAYSQVIYQSADLIARETVNQIQYTMKDLGIPTSQVDIKRMEFAVQQQQRLVELRKRLTLASREFSSNNNASGAKECQTDLARVNQMLKEIPQPPTAELLKKNKFNCPSYWDNLNSFTKLRAPGIEKAVNTLGPKVEKLEKGSKGAGGESGGGSNATGGSAYEAVVTVSATVDAKTKAGGVDVFINGVKVDRTKQSVSIRLGQPFVVKLVAVDARRAFIRNFEEPTNTTKNKSDDYMISYTTDNGSFKGTTTWNMSSEEYLVGVSGLNSDSAQYTQSSSGLQPGIKNDLITFKFTRPFQATIQAAMSSEWKSHAQRPGGIRDGSEKGSAKATIQLNIYPR
ncbi:hypothetical protein [Armatimonas sp.]|uniref:hypothetical protein n=1 Tax=Armatimonas sp. TaxID=1872638 RepID=UPI003753943F